MPAAVEVQSQLSGKQAFTVIGMKDSNWQVRLTEKSSFLCTFHMLWGHMHFKRMMFGISSPEEVLQKPLNEVISDIEGCHIIADETIRAGQDNIDQA